MRQTFQVLATWFVTAARVIDTIKPNYFKTNFNITCPVKLHSSEKIVAPRWYWNPPFFTQSSRRGSPT